MKDPDSTALLERAAPAIDALVATLRDEADALGTLDALLEQQLDALRAGTPGVLEDAAAQVHDCAATLETLKQKRARQTRLLGRVLEIDAEPDALQALVATLQQRAGAEAGARLAEARASVQHCAQETQQRGETLRFALECAADLNRDLLLALRGAAGRPGGQTYTAAGHAQAATAAAAGPGARLLLNAVG